MIQIATIVKHIWAYDKTITLEEKEIVGGLLMRYGIFLILGAYVYVPEAVRQLISTLEVVMTIIILIP